MTRAQAEAILALAEEPDVQVVELPRRIPGRRVMTHVRGDGRAADGFLVPAGSQLESRECHPSGRRGAK
jgi:hypothetical protein